MLRQIEDAFVTHQSVMVRMPIGPDKTVLLTEQVKSEESDGIAARAEISWLVEVCRAVMYVQHKVLGLPDEKMHFVRYYPAEALSEPIFRTWHFFWRMKNKE